MIRGVVMHFENKGKIAYVLQTINIIPLLLFGIVIILSGTRWFTKTMYDEIEVELGNVAHNVITLFEVAYPGDYHLEGDLAYQLLKGDTDITSDYGLIDRVKEDTGLDVTLFYQDTRILTTIYNSAGERIIGTGAPETVKQDVLATGEEHFYNNTVINGTTYFSYYMPIRNSDGSVTGILFVGKPSSQVNLAIQRSIYPLLIADLIAMLITALCLFFYTRAFASVLLKIHRFLSEVSTGDLNAELDSSVLRRGDELGDIGRSALSMQRSLRNMVEHDSLTDLFNRRSGDRKLHQVIERASARQTPFCIAIGDVDFFKRVNDSYGHECGDMVLKNIADILRLHMHSHGFAARWGGEEFLLVFDHADLDTSREVLDGLLHAIRTMETGYDGNVVKVTMTFGLTEGNTSDFKQLIRNADAKLYEGKTAGRDRITV